ncbi:hypothetical protein BDW59DRAFT_180833 [Aspergillus cavernicola]|uniref:Zn(2)-C6 fungal-type domain-containing protein n=1 Tax=Aspergillus cavernicola TaxID=176166 RepID=A0ABR4I4Z3_9EURO
MNPEIPPRKPVRKAKAKVKSGCRTCKIRKVKCDEHFPICHRCHSTGRVCDGYGVWGGGGNHYWLRPSSDGPRDILDFPSLARISTPATSMDEKASFDWFRGRTIVKLPGSYLSDFWTTILLQASQSEQAVWHATMALSFTHRGGFVDIGSDPANKLEQSTLRHCIKAVRHLHPHFSARDKASSRVVLIVCLVFVVLDLLRGHFTSAQIHLRNGLHILAETQPPSLQTPPESLDNSIAEAFFRLNTQVELLQHHHHHPRPCILPPPLQPPIPNQFRSYTAAWHSLDNLMKQVIHLSAQARELHPPNPESTLLSTHQQQILTALNAWITTYTTSLPTLQLSISQTIAEAKAKVHRLVCGYYIMLTIMTETCLLQPDNETVFDTHTHSFNDLINTLSELWTLTINHPDHSTIPSSSPSLSLNPLAQEHAQTPRGSTPRRIGEGCDMSHTIIDIGWMPPLFFTATKCRDRHIRRSAIRLLESTNHREGIWDAKITACIARRVMEIEEGDFFDGADGDCDGDDFFGGDGESGDQSIDIPVLLPESCRIRDLEVRLEGDPLERVVLFGGWEGISGGKRVCIGEYDVVEQRWL